MSKQKNTAGDIRVQSPLFKKLDNYWYHYKWHTVIALFLVAVILICSLQMCAKEEYDIEVLYAGDGKLNNKQAILDIEAAFSDLLTDQTGDGIVSVNLVSYWVDDDISLDTEVEGGLSPTDISYTLNYSMNNQKAYVDEVKAGNVSLFLVSPHLFHMVDDEAGFMRVTDLFPELKTYEDEVCVFDEDGKINRFGVVLSKTEFGQRAGLCDLPEDTILCVRKPSAMKGWFGAEKAQAAHTLATDVFKNALALGKKQ